MGKHEDYMQYVGTRMGFHCYEARSNIKSQGRKDVCTVLVDIARSKISISLEGEGMEIVRDWGNKCSIR